MQLAGVQYETPAQAKDVELVSRGRTSKFAHVPRQSHRRGHGDQWGRPLPQYVPSSEKSSVGGHIDAARFTNGRIAVAICAPAVTMYAKVCVQIFENFDNNGEGYVSLYHSFFSWPVMFV